MNRASFCHECGLMLRPRYPGGDPENGPARPECMNPNHEALTDMLEQATNAGFKSAVEEVLELIEIHLDATGGMATTQETRDLQDSDDEPQSEYRRLRSLRKTIVEDILEVPEEQYDNDRNELENPEGL